MSNNTKKSDENIFQTLKKIEQMFPSSSHSYDFFLKHKDYFKLHNFSGSKFSKREGDKTPSTVTGKFLKTTDFGADGSQLNIIEFIRDIENEKLIEEFGFEKAKDLPNFITFKMCEKLEKNKELIASVNGDYKLATTLDGFNTFSKFEKDNHARRSNSYKTAINILKNLVGWTSDMNLNIEIYTPDVQAKVIQKPYKERYIQRMSRKLTANSSISEPILSGLLRTCSAEERAIAIKAFDIGLNDYEFENVETGKFETVYRLFITERDYDGVPHGSFRYNRCLAPKGLIRSNSKRVLLGEHLIKNFSKNVPIIFSEGHSDVVVNTAKGLQCVTSGSSTTKIGESIVHLQGFELHLFPDADEAGFKGAIMKSLEIENHNKTVPDSKKIRYKVKPWSFNIEKYFDDKGNEQGGIFTFENRSEWIHKEFDKGLYSNLSIDEALELTDPKNWKPVTSSPLKKGFDFIDFHSKIDSLENGSKAKEMSLRLLSIYKK